MSSDADDSSPIKITLTRTDAEWVARDAGTGRTGRGSSREAALAALDEALAESSVDVPDVIPATDPLFRGRGLFSSADSFDTTESDDVLYGDSGH